MYFKLYNNSNKKIQSNIRSQEYYKRLCPQNTGLFVIHKIYIHIYIYDILNHNLPPFTLIYKTKKKTLFKTYK
jgi:hypothetical protein